MISDYYKLLKQHYIIPAIWEFSDITEDDISIWFHERQDAFDAYRIALIKNNILYNSSNYIEIGKGVVDTIVSVTDDTLISSDYINTFNRLDFNGRLLSKDIRFGYNPYILTEDWKIRNFKVYKMDHKTKLLMHNVYNMEDLDLMREISTYDIDFVVGAFGKLNDKDRLNKINTLRNFKDTLLDCNIKEYYSYIGDNYIYFIQNKHEYGYQKKKISHH